MAWRRPPRHRRGGRRRKSRWGRRRAAVALPGAAPYGRKRRPEGDRSGRQRHEYSDSRRGRPRACAGGGVGEIAAPVPPLCRARQPGALSPKTSRSTDDHRAIVDFCRKAAIGLVVVGPEAPLVAGVVDDLAAAGHPLFRAEQGGGAARRLEGLRQGLLPRVRHSDRRLSSLLATRRRRSPTSAPRARRSSSRPTASPPAKGSSSR